jgi:hypothetical protein
MITTTANFIDLHEAIQDACGWYNSHLFQFKDGKGRMLAGLPDGQDNVTTPDAINPISEVLGSMKRKRISYIYDLGDFWEHDIELVRTDRNWPEEFGRQLLGGARAFPPEDCGGIEGYERCCKVATGKQRDPERLDWLEGWHPERVDLKETARLFYQAKLFLRAHYEERI